MKYRLAQDIVIPKGTVVDPAPTKTTYFVPFGEIVLGHGPDHTSYWRMPVDEGLELGILEEFTDLPE